MHQTVVPGISRPIYMPLVVTATDLIFRKNFELLWFDKLHVEIIGVLRGARGSFPSPNFRNI